MEKSDVKLSTNEAKMVRKKQFTRAIRRFQQRTKASTGTARSAVFRYRKTIDAKQ